MAAVRACQLCVNSPISRDDAFAGFGWRDIQLIAASFTLGIDQVELESR